MYANAYKSLDFELLCFFDLSARREKPLQTRLSLRLRLLQRGRARRNKNLQTERERRRRRRRVRTGSNRGGGGGGGRRGRTPFSHLQNSAGGTEERIPPLHCSTVQWQERVAG